MSFSGGGKISLEVIRGGDNFGLRGGGEVPDAGTDKELLDLSCGHREGGRDPGTGTLGRVHRDGHLGGAGGGDKQLHIDAHAIVLHVANHKLRTSVIWSSCKTGIKIFKYMQLRKATKHAYNFNYSVFSLKFFLCIIKMFYT